MSKFSCMIVAAFVLFVLGSFNQYSTVHCQTYVGLGRFESFLLNYFDVLINYYSSKKIIRYCKQVHWILIDQSEYREMDELADQVGELCRQDGDSLKDDLRQYQKEIYKKLPAIVAFFQAMDTAFTELQTVQFNSYNNYLVDNSMYPHPDASEKTKWLVKDVIIQTIQQFLTTEQKYDLKRKLRKAVKEYQRDTMESDPDFKYLVNYFKTKTYPDLDKR